MNFLSLVLSLPTENATLRMRVWRNLKSVYAAALRDGVYLLPDRAPCRTLFEGLRHEVMAASGTAYLLPVTLEEPEYLPLFDRTDDYTALGKEITTAAETINPTSASDTLKVVRKIRKSFQTLAETDYFPAEPRDQCDAALTELERRVARSLSPDEPAFTKGARSSLDRADYQGRVWATRKRPWVDRLASGWLIRSFIDPKARFLWLGSPADCPDDALGFDFDGAHFTHANDKVTFEVLIESFDVAAPGLSRLADIVHYLDVGGLQPSEATGLEAVLRGLQHIYADDDALNEAAYQVFNGLLSVFAEREAHV